ncbi:MAG: 6-pyruvoyl-tetrahydropterin synthase-related protein [Microgenomates group bacterium]
MKKSSLLFIGIVLLLQIPLVLPLFHNGFYYSQDDFAIQRVTEYYVSFINGDFPARWSSNLLSGYGYPLFTFYSPMVYILGALLVRIGLTPTLAVKLLYFTAFLIGPIGIYVYMKNLTKKVPAFMSAVIFSFAPYRATDAYVRGNISEFAAFSLLPWIMYANFKQRQQSTSRWAIMHGVLLGILIATHHISAIIYGVFFVLYTMFLLTITPQGKMQYIKSLCASLGIAVSLSCFYWLPALVESKYLRIGNLLQFNLDIFLLKLNELWHSHWGYGGITFADPMSLQVGKTLLVLSILTVILNVFIKSSEKYKIAFWTITFLLFTYMETVYSASVWSSIPLLHLIRIPWRFHMITTIIGSILSGYFIYFLTKWIKTTTVSTYGMFLCICSICMLTIALNTGFFKPNGYYENYTQHETTTWDDEYLPIWVKEKPTGSQKEKIHIVEGDGYIDNVEWKYNHIEFATELENPSEIEITHVYYPGWLATVDNQKISIQYDNQGGLMHVNIPQGYHVVHMAFKKTPSRIFSELVSLVCILYLLYFTVKSFLNGVLVKRS